MMIVRMIFSLTRVLIDVQVIKSNHCGKTTVPLSMNFFRSLVVLLVLLLTSACAPRLLQIIPDEGPPGTAISLSMEYLVGWPRVEIAGKSMDFRQLKLMAMNSERKDVPGEELVWIEDKILEFTIPDLPPGEYKVTVHDDKGPPGDPVYSFLETTAYLIFPPVWPFVFRSNQAQFSLRVLPE
jgi:hypothetical protein